MADTSRRGSPIEWFCPDPRGVIPLDAFHTPKSLVRVVRSSRFQIRTDTSFARVMDECAAPRGGWNRPWMNQRLKAAYVGLFESGHAHSVEAWLGDELVGGLYGVHIGAAFFGESMFSRASRGGTNASKVCLVHLVQRLRAGGFLLLDTQMVNPHLRQFGACEVTADAYLDRLATAIQRSGTWNSEDHATPSRNGTLPP